MAVKVGRYSIWDLTQKPARNVYQIIKKLTFNAHDKPVAEPIVAELLTRLALLNQLGLSYLSLARSGNTLSGGEAQRIRLAAQLGSNLTGVCYILDEPTIGLHARDNRILIDALKTLRDRGNTILVVEHDEETIREADTIVDLGPGAGQGGGRVVASGKLADLKKVPLSVTGALLDGNPKKITSRLRPYKKLPAIAIQKAAVNNLKKVNAKIPLGCLIAVTGVSGSGKSSLLKETLYRGLRNRLLKQRRPAGRCKDIKGWQNLDARAGSRPQSHRPHTTFRAGFLCRVFVGNSQIVLADPAGPGQRIFGRPLFIQCGRRSLRNLQRTGPAEGGNEFFARCLCAL